MLGIQTDVVIIGAGFAGLMSADRLTRLGYSVTIVDRAPRTLAGTSSRNEGWLHAGTYHALSVVSLREAVAVAKRCRYGWSEIQRRFPASIEPESAPSVAVIPRFQVDEALERWDAAGVGHRALNARQLSRLREEVVLQDDEVAFSSDDLGVNTRMIAAGLQSELTRRGTQFVLSAQILNRTGNMLRLATPDGPAQISYRFLVCAAGYNMEETCRELGFPPTAVRLWRSHLVTVPRLASMSVFGVAPGAAAAINHGGWSIVGLNEDATKVPEATFDVDPIVRELLVRRVMSRFPNADMSRARHTACVKVDYAPDPASPRSLNVRMLALGDDAVALLPGKMTEAPSSANIVATHVFETLGHQHITTRPLDDILNNTESELAHAN